MHRNNKLRLGVATGFRGRGFTLIELLVVIAIIALLVSILVPSLQRARELARQTVCQSHLRTLHTAISLYGSEFNAFLPDEGRWPINFVLREYLQSATYKCPSATKVLDGPGDVPIAGAFIYPNEQGLWYAKLSNSPTSSDPPAYMQNVKSAVSYGWNYRGMGYPSYMSQYGNISYTTFDSGRPDDKGPQKSERFAASVILMAENNNDPLAKEWSCCFACARRVPYIPGNASIATFNARHDSTGGTISMDGRAAMCLATDLFNPSTNLAARQNTRLTYWGIPANTTTASW